MTMSELQPHSCQHKLDNVDCELERERERETTDGVTVIPYGEEGEYTTINVL